MTTRDILLRAAEIIDSGDEINDALGAVSYAMEEMKTETLALLSIPDLDLTGDEAIAALRRAAEV